MNNNYSREVKDMKRFIYKGRKTREISFPLGGIGTGCIGLAGNGRLIDWEIFNRPNKGSFNGFSHFAIKAERSGQVLDARVLNGDLQPPYTGEFGWKAEGNKHKGFGFGPHRQNLAGMPHFRDVVFIGQYPIATLEFNEQKFPGMVSLTAFNPFIPLNDKDSGIPAAFFEFTIRNSTDKQTDYTIAATLCNSLPANNINEYNRTGEFHYIQLMSDVYKETDVNYGDFTLATDITNASHQDYWFCGKWFDSLEIFWQDFTTPGKLRQRQYDQTQSGDFNHGTLAAYTNLMPGETKKIRFIISWHFPNCTNYWNTRSCEIAQKKGIPLVWKNYYAKIWKNSKDVATYALENWSRLYARTLQFKEALFSSDLPPVVLDAVSANLSVLKSPTVMRLEDGTFYGWEGCLAREGCCEGSCTHVWNYAQALPFLFPKLERSMRETDYRYNQKSNGKMYFRLMLPLGVDECCARVTRACADGLFGGVMKAYRDWKICGDTDWLRGIWPFIKKSIEYAWANTNEDRWDPEKSGVLWGRQHHTLDMELFGPNSWLSGFYLGALKAGSIMAEALCEVKIARELKSMFDRGKKWVDANLFNDEYYHQLINLKDKKILEQFSDQISELKENYWSEEYGEMKYQIGEGCEIEQVLAQWHANLYGLGEIFDPAQGKKALLSVFKYNFKKPLRDYYNPCRVYSLNDEDGLVICHWPEGRQKPIFPLPYSQETQNGYEYAAAIQMIQTGLVEEGLTVVEAIRDRYDGERRNPWNEFECGSNYARSMASYALLNAFSRFQFNMVEGVIGFHPLIKKKNGEFKCFWSLDPGWGIVKFSRETIELHLLFGNLKLKKINLPSIHKREIQNVYLDESAVTFEKTDSEIHFSEPVMINEGQILKISL